VPVIRMLALARACAIVAGGEPAVRRGEHWIPFIRRCWHWRGGRTVLCLCATSFVPRSLRKPVSQHCRLSTACSRDRPGVHRARPRSAHSHFWASTACASALCVARTPVGAAELLWCSLLFAGRNPVDSNPWTLTRHSLSHSPLLRCHATPVGATLR